MNKDLLRRHIKKYLASLDNNPQLASKEQAERRAKVKLYQSWTASRLLKMSEEDVYEYIAPLWAMLIWGNKHYVVDKMIAENGFDNLREQLAELVWGSGSLAGRWDGFREKIAGMGPAMRSELLCLTHPDSCMLWNRRAYVGLQYLGVPDLPRYDYQFTGAKYEALCKVTEEIAKEMRTADIKDADHLTVDYFIWSELQVLETLADLAKPAQAGKEKSSVEVEEDKKNFVHNEIRDKIADIGEWLGLRAQTEKKVADGAVVDTIWEVTVGNMGRVIYVFEVQAGGSIKGLLVNLLKSLNNPAVQGVVAVSDAGQIEKIKKEANGIQGLSGKLKYWNYEEVMKVYDALAEVNTSINALGLVPQGF